MKVALAHRPERLVHLLREFKARPLSYDERSALREQESTVVIADAAGATDLSAYRCDFLFRYDIFPQNIMRFAAEWQQAGRAMQAGDVIVQEASLPPLPISLKLIFGVRVLAVFREPTRVGFSYATLAGHAEQGRSEFSCSLRDGVIRATIHTFSSPGTFLTRLLAPVATLPYQRYCTTAALERMKSAFLAETPGGTEAE